MDSALEQRALLRERRSKEFYQVLLLKQKQNQLREPKENMTQLQLQKDGYSYCKFLEFISQKKYSRQVTDDIVEELLVAAKTGSLRTLRKTLHQYHADVDSRNIHKRTMLHEVKTLFRSYSDYLGS